MNSKKLSYEEKIAKIETFLDVIESESVPFAKISVDAQEALSLLKECEAELLDFQTKISKKLEEGN